MPDWDKILTQVSAVMAAPIPFFVALLVVPALIWWLMNWRYSAVISHRDSEITLLNGQRDDYKEKLGGASPDQAKAQIDALEARLARVEPRRISEAQRIDLAARLRSPGKAYWVAVTRDVSCADGHLLAAGISEAFTAAGGWQVTNNLVMGIGNFPPQGVAVQCDDINNRPVEAKIIIDAMRAVGIRFDLQPRARIPPHAGIGPPDPTVEILVTTPAAS